MKIQMVVKNLGDEKGYPEECDIDNSMDPEEYAQNLIKNFNNNLRPGERPRELVSNGYKAESLPKPKFKRNRPLKQRKNKCE